MTGVEGTAGTAKLVLSLGFSASNRIQPRSLDLLKLLTPQIFSILSDRNRSVIRRR